MVFKCVLCEGEEWCYTTSLCSKCRVIKHTITLYGDRFFETVDRVFVRNPQGQLKKEQDALKEEEKCIKDKVIGDESHIVPTDKMKLRSETTKI